MSTAAPAPPEKLTKKMLTADHPTWCPGCGDFAVLAAFYKVLEKLQIPHEKIVTIAGIGCSSRFPYFVNSHGLHYIHGRALPLATGISLSRPDVHVFAFGGDGDGFSIGGNHLDHCARKNVNLTYVIMDNSVYGLTKAGAIDQPVNPMRKLVASGASFVGRTHASQVKHMMEMFERAIKHPGFSVVEVLSECVIFYPGAFDSSIPRKGGEFEVIDERKWDESPEDDSRHDVTDFSAAMRLSEEASPGKFGTYYEVDRPSKNVLEQKWIDESKAKLGGASAKEVLQARFNQMK
jgi:2-oxoglutarate/2-oxoacid ferredoxin oxidoreductase subunit beta